MTSSNRVQLTQVRENNPGVTPNNPRMRTARITGETLSFTPDYVDSDEFRADRMLGDPIKVMHASDGGLNFELSFPVNNEPLSDWLRSALFNIWDNTHAYFNDGVAGSQISAVVNDAGVTTFIVADLGFQIPGSMRIRSTGFANPENNFIWRSATGGSPTTVLIAGTPATVNEPNPPGTARIKTVGFQGNTGVITATSTGLGGTFSYTNRGLKVGQWIKVGGTNDPSRFNTAANNGWARIAAIDVNSLTLDNRPPGWSVDNGEDKLIVVYVSDQIKNGILPTALTLEKGFLGQNTPTYIVNRGMQVNTLNLSAVSRQKINGQITFMGMGGGQSTTSLDAVPDIATINPIMAANANVGRLGEAGARVQSPNWCRQLEININNNLRTLESVDQASPVGLAAGECTVTGRGTFYFGNNALLTKLYEGTPTSLSIRFEKAHPTLGFHGQAVVITLPRVTFRAGSPNATAKNQDVVIDMEFTASLDPVTNSVIYIDRFEEFAT